MRKIDPLVVGDALLSFDELPPLSSYEEISANGHDKEQKIPPRAPIDWGSLTGEPPARTWWIQDWLGPWPTLTSGPGGAGKTQLWQAVASSIATGRAYLSTQCKPLKVLMWMCEESQDEVWRRQVAINAHLNLDMQSLDNLSIVPRMGLDNTLMDLAFGRPAFSPLLRQLKEQVNDLKADVLVLDNLAQLFGGNENDKHHVTYFVNAISGLVMDRPFAPVFIGHVARSAGSEFSGSAAWENAVRMRWYVGPTLPDQKPASEDEPIDSDVVYLARRKANYADKDWRKFYFQRGMLVPEETQADAGEMFRNDAADKILIVAFGRLKMMGIQPADGKQSGDYLPNQALAKGLASGYSKAELTKAMNRLMAIGRLKRVQIGQYSNRTPKFGLELCTI
jgi:RecA-family ATPase